MLEIKTYILNSTFNIYHLKFIHSASNIHWSDVSETNKPG